MAYSSVKEVNWEELCRSFPSPIYKYRTWKKPEHRSILKKSQVFLASPNSFTDPFDCKNRVEYENLTDGDILQMYLLESQENNHGFSNEEHIRFANDWLIKTPLRNASFLFKEQEREFKEMDERLGILSLTADPANSRMWEEYSDKHSGICVGFDSCILFSLLGGGGNVEYCSTLPTIRPRPFDDFNQQHIKQVFYKLDNWCYEKEYRTKRFFDHPATDQERTITLPKEAFKEIILGTNISPMDENEIINICEDDFPLAKIKKAIKVNTNIISIVDVK